MVKLDTLYFCGRKSYIRFDPYCPLLVSLSIIITHLATSIMLVRMRHNPWPTRLLSLFLLLLRLLLLTPRRLLLPIRDTLRHRARRPSRDAANDACHRPEDSAADDGRINEHSEEFASQEWSPFRMVRIVNGSGNVEETWRGPDTQ